MKAILLFTVLLCSNALASPSGLRCRLQALGSCILPSPPSTERSALASTSSLTGPPSTEPRLPSPVDPVDEFFDTCQPQLYLACQKSARVLLKADSTGEFARKLIRNAIDKENVWAVSALSEVGQFEPDFYLELFENFFQEGKNHRVFEVLARKSKEIDPVRAGLVTGRFEIRKPELYKLATTIMENQPPPNFVPEDQVSSGRVGAIKRSIEREEHELVYESATRFFTPRALRQANLLSHASKHGAQFMVFYATKDVDASDPSIDEAYEAAKNPAEVPISGPVIRKSAIQPISLKDTKDVVEYLQEIIAKRG